LRAALSGSADAVVLELRPLRSHPTICLTSHDHTLPDAVRPFLGAGPLSGSESLRAMWLPGGACVIYSSHMIYERSVSGGKGLGPGYLVLQ
jgi:hypothetical protein